MFFFTIISIEKKQHIFTFSKTSAKLQTLTHL